MPDRLAHSFLRVSINLVSTLALFCAASAGAQDAFQLGTPTPVDQPLPRLAPSNAPKAAESPPTVNAGEYTDNKNGVIWRRCELGTTINVNGSACVGTPVKADWVTALELIRALNAARFEGHGDWRLPAGPELRSLLLDDARMHGGKRPVSRGAASSFGGYFLETDEGKCSAANSYVYELFAKLNVGTDNFFEGQRWMADNPDDKDWQNPLSLNLHAAWGFMNHGRCNLVIYAFLEDWFDSKRKGEMRPHAGLPLLLVRGGEPSAEWMAASTAIPRKQEILERSRRNAKHTIASLNATFDKVSDYLRQIMAEGRAAEASASSSPPAPTGKDARPTDNSSFLCEVRCTNANVLSYAEKSTLTVQVRAPEAHAAREESVRYAKNQCYAQTGRVYETGSASCRKH